MTGRGGLCGDLTGSQTRSVTQKRRRRLHTDSHTSGTRRAVGERSGPSNNPLSTAAPAIWGTSLKTRIGSDNMRLFRLALPTSKIDEARVFYEEVFGCDADDTVPTRLYYHCDNTIVALIDWSAEGRGDFAPNAENLYFAVTDLEEVLARAERAGARITSPVEVRPWGERSFYCLDLDGNHLCFVDDQTLFLGRGAAWA